METDVTSKKRRNDVLLLVGTIVLIFSLLFMVLRPSITGFITDRSSDSITRHIYINETYSSMTEMPLDVPKGANITTLRINARIYGNASIYVSDGIRMLLVASTLSQKEGLSSITGFEIYDDALSSDSVIVEDRVDNAAETSETEVITPQDIQEIEENASETVVEDVIADANDTRIIENETNVSDETRDPDGPDTGALPDIEVQDFEDTSMLDQETILDDACVETCDFVMGHDAELLIWPDEGSSVYISDISISYVLQREMAQEIQDNDTKAQLETRLSKVNVNNVIKRDIGPDMSRYDLFIDDKGSSDSIIIRGIKDISSLQDVGFKKKGHSHQMATDIAYVNSLEIDNATIRIAANEPISAIAVCSDYDPATDACTEWKQSDILFTQEDGFITFTVRHFTGYAGLPLSYNTSRKYANDNLPVMGGFRGTDLTVYPDLMDVPALYIENSSYGKINWSSGRYNVAYLNFTKNILIGPKYIYVNSSGLNPTLNSTATVDIYGLTYAYPAIYRDGSLCTACTIISYSSGKVRFIVPGFSNYTVGSSANLSISDETDSGTRFANDPVRFYANYSNITNGLPINGSGTYCEYIQNSSVSWSTPVNMTFSTTSKLYEYTKTFSSGGSFAFNVSCHNDLGYDNLTATDRFVLNASSCKTLSSGNSIYTLHNNLTSATTCFAINANNVTLDCSGYTITYSTNGLSGYAVSVNSVDNITIRNCNIIDGDFGGYSGRDAISLYDSENAQVYNNTVNVGASSALMLTTVNASIWNNTLISNSFKTIYLYDASGNFLFNNTVQSGADSAIELYNTNLTLMTNVGSTGTGAGSLGIAMIKSSDNMFVDSNISGIEYDVAANISSVNNTFLNCTFLSSKESVLSSSEIVRKWYFDANVTNSTGSPLNGVNVTITNSSSSIIYSQLTDASGDLSRIELVEYVNYDGTSTYSTPHTLVASLSGYVDNATTYNISSENNVFANLVMQQAVIVSVPPAIIWIADIPDQIPVESSQRIIAFNFTVDDGDGVGNVNVSSARVIMDLSGIVRQSGLCSGASINSTALNISCNVSLQYYDPAGVWSVNVSISDNDGNYTQDITKTLTYDTLYAIELNTGLYDMGAIDAGSKNNTAGILQLNNTGNFNYTLVQIKAFDLVNGSYYLNASNFRINITNSSSGKSLSNNTFVNISGAALPRSTDSSIGNQSMYLYVDVPLGTAARKFKSSFEWMLSLS